MTVDNSACFPANSKPLINCLTCNTAFSPRQKNAKYCSVACNNKRIRTGNTSINCIVCGKAVFRSRHGGNDSRMCCSRECGFKWQAYIRKEVAALRRFGANTIAQYKMPAINLLVEHEVNALRVIRFKNQNLKLCKLCTQPVYGKYFKLHAACRNIHKRNKKESYKKTESYRQSKRNQRAKRKALERGAMTVETVNVETILERDNYYCYLCGIKTPRELRGTYADNAPEIDHVIPLSKGGLHIESNLRCACRKCNAEKSDRIYPVSR